MASITLPVSKEQAFLEAYFQCIHSCAFDKAKEKTDREKELHKLNPVSPTWVSMVTCLTSFSLAEKDYSSLLFLSHNLSHKFFGRKDSLRHSFTNIQNDLKKVEENSAKPTKTAVVTTPIQTDYSLEELLGHLCGQLGQYITARIKTIEFFSQMSTLSQYKNLSYEDLLVMITEIIQENQKAFHHPTLSPLRTSFLMECDIISHLLQAQIQIQHCQFLSSLLLLSEAHNKLSTWGSGLAQKETKTGLFSTSFKQPPLPALYQWLQRFKVTLVSKFTLYFYEVLSKQGPTAEVKGLTSRTSVDFIAKMSHFHKKTDAFCTTLVYDTNSLPADHQYKGPGYHHPQRTGERLAGLDSYPAIFSYPGEKADKHWPGVISIMTDKVLELNTMEKIVCFYDDKIQSTYFMTRIEPRMTLVVIYECKKSEKDSYVVNFLNEVCSHLRCTKLFASLKPGVK